MKQRTYLCIDLKSFYASVECVARGMDPMTENLVVADPERTEKTICLAITPAMKALGIRNRCRIFEIPKHVRYTVAPPRMQKYIDTAADIYSIYLQYIAREDIHVYSIDEAFFDLHGIAEPLDEYGRHIRTHDPPQYGHSRQHRHRPPRKPWRKSPRNWRSSTRS